MEATEVDVEKDTTPNGYTEADMVAPTESMGADLAEQEDENQLQNDGKLKRQDSVAFSPIDYIIIVVHGLAVHPESLKQNKRDFKQAIKFVQNYWFWELEFRVHVEFLDWKQHIDERQSRILERIAPRYNAGPTNYQALGHHTTILVNALSDFLFYITPPHGDFITYKVAEALNHCVQSLRERPHGRFRHSKIVLLGHSLGGVILHEVLTHQCLRPGGSQHALLREQNENVSLEEDTTPQTNENMPMSVPTPPPITFPIEGFFLFGCPLAAFITAHSNDSQRSALRLPSGIKTYNIYHPHDPVSFRLEPLFYAALDPMPPSVVLPYWRNNGPRDYVRWSRDAETARRAIVDYVHGVTVKASDGLKSVLRRIQLPGDASQTADDTSGHDLRPVPGPPVEATVQFVESDLVDPNTVVPPVDQNSQVPKAKTPSNSSETPPPRIIRLRILAERRYGNHDRQPQLRFADAVRRKRLMTSSSNNPKHVSNSRRVDTRDEETHNKPDVEAEENSGPNEEKQLTLPPKRTRRAATLRRLLNVMGIDRCEKALQETTKALGHSHFQDDPSNMLEGESLSLTPDDNVDVVSECELEGGLELPTRLDFELQENTAEHYVVALGNLQSHFNYWKSRDAVLFLLKQITCFRPRVPYADLLKVLELAEKHGTRESGNGTTGRSDGSGRGVVDRVTLVSRPPAVRLTPSVSHGSAGTEHSLEEGPRNSFHHRSTLLPPSRTMPHTYDPHPKNSNSRSSLSSREGNSPFTRLISRHMVRPQKGLKGAVGTGETSGHAFLQ